MHVRCRSGCVGSAWLRKWISSKSGLQSTIAIFNTDSELTSGTACAREVVGTNHFIKEIFLGVILPAAVMFGDCQVANSIGAGLASTRRAATCHFPRCGSGKSQIKARLY